MIAASHFIINTLLQWGVLCGEETQSRFNDFYALSKTAGADGTPPPHSYTPLEQSVNEKNMILGYLPWNRKNDLKDGGRDGESTRVFPLTPPSPPGRGRTSECSVNVRGMLASIPRMEARCQGSPTNTCTTERSGALGPSRRAEWFSLSFGERDGVRGKGLSCCQLLSFQPLAPVLFPPEKYRGTKNPLRIDRFAKHSD
jgi:hypothetical protein